jgi:GT2 family glycosyltransferase
LGLGPSDLQSIELLASVCSAEEIRIDRISTISEAGLLWKIIKRRPSRIPHYLLSSFRGSWARTVMARTALDLSRVTEFAEFVASRKRDLEPAGLDRNAILPAEGGKAIGFVLVAGNADQREALMKSFGSLAGQTDKNFHLWAAIAPDLIKAAREIVSTLQLEGKVDLIQCAPRAAAEHAALELVQSATTEWIGQLKPGDLLDSKAVLLFRSFLASHPDLEVFYADNAEADPWIRKVLPHLKPDWSPTFFRQVDYIGRPCLVRRDLIASASMIRRENDTAPWWSALAATCEAGDARKIGHLKRVLMQSEPSGPREIRPLSLASILPTEVSIPHLVSIIIPTRDRVELLRRAIGTIRERTAGALPYEIIVVDNDSTDPSTIEYLRSIERQANVSVVRHPGAFNFSKLVNRGVEEASGRMLVLFNNDCEVVNETWLDELAALAFDASVGAVGGLLLYDDGRIQHAGVTLGLGAGAGHRDRNMPPDVHVGHLFRLRAVHEVSAVTGACLTVERQKYHEVGGFDPAFAVAFNDVDFCLRLQERGYRNLLASNTVLKHLESATRGSDIGPKRARFDSEAARFRERWRAVVHDDPYYHPLFSTTRFNDWLG